MTNRPTLRETYLAALAAVREDIETLEKYIDEVENTEVVDFERLATRFLLVSSRSGLLAHSAKELDSAAAAIRNRLRDRLEQEAREAAARS